MVARHIPLKVFNLPLPETAFMEFRNFTYLLLMLGALAGPLAFSFEKQIRFYSKLKYLLPAILFSGAIFLLLGVRFAELGIWSFNPRYITGFYIMNLPAEEWLFFMVAPYSCVFIYELLKVKLPHFEKPNLFVGISLVMLAVFAIIAYTARQHLYTFFTFFLLTIYFGYTIFRNRFKQHYTKFYLTWLLALIPYTLIFSILTGLPVIEYNEMHTLGMKIIRIPLENFFYFFLLLLMNITIYEYMKTQQIFKFPKRQ